MKSSRGVCLALIAVMCLLTAARATVFELKDDTVEQFNQLLVDQNKTLVVVAHRQPCVDRCEQTYQKILASIDQLLSLDAAAQVYRVDFSKHPDFEARFQLDQPFGVFFVFREHTLRVDAPEDDTQTPESILNQVIYLLAARIIEITSKEQVSAELKNDTYLRIYHGTKSDEAYSLVEVLAKNSYEKIYFIQDEQLAVEFKIEAPGFYTFRRSDDHALPLPGSIYSSRLVKFISTSAAALPQQFNLEKLESSLHDQSLPVLLVYGLSKQTRDRLQLLLKVNSELLRSYFHVFELTDPSDSSQSHYFKECFLHEGDDFLVCILRIREQVLYRYLYQQSHLGDASFRSFISNYVQHRLTPQLKTEDIRETETGKVHNLNLETYSEFMSLSTPKAVHYLVVYYYEDNCKKCDAFTPTFIEAANANVDTQVTFMRINLSKNEMPETFHIRTPAVHFTTGYDDEHTINYRGSWTLEDFNMWLVHSRDDYFHLEHYDEEEEKVARKLRKKQKAAPKQQQAKTEEEATEPTVDL